MHARSYQISLPKGRQHIHFNSAASTILIQPTFLEHEMPVKTPVYLDHNATTPIAEEIVRSMMPFFTENFGNPSSAHCYGDRPREAVAQARRQVAQLIGTTADHIRFTSGGTEANNLALFGVANSGVCKRILTTNVEHPATLGPCKRLEASGWEVVRLPVVDSGLLDMRALRAATAKKLGLLTIMHANNETGVIQPLRGVAEIGKSAGAVIHVDAAQSDGKIPIDVDRLNVDLLSIAGHKIYAPKGIGALYVRDPTQIGPHVLGGGQEQGLRPGTENVPYIVGLGEACRIASDRLTRDMQRLAALRDELYARILGSVPGLRLNGEGAPRLPNTLNICFPGCIGSELLQRCPEIAASTGSACHAGNHHPSAVLIAMNVDPDTALGAVRLSVGRSTTQEDIHFAARQLSGAWKAITTTV